MTQVTAWDRNGTLSGSSEVPTYDEISTYGSSYKQAATAFSKNSVTSSIYATDISERSTFCPTLRVGYVGKDES